MLERIATEAGVQGRVNGVLLDHRRVVGAARRSAAAASVSSRHGPLDMRMDPDTRRERRAWLNRAGEEEIADVHSSIWRGALMRDASPVPSSWHAPSRRSPTRCSSRSIASRAASAP